VRYIHVVYPDSACNYCAQEFWLDPLTLHVAASCSEVSWLLIGFRIMRRCFWESIFNKTGSLFRSFELYGSFARASTGLKLWNCSWSLRLVIEQLYTQAYTAPPSHEEKGLVTTEQFLGCVKSAVLILDKPRK